MNKVRMEKVHTNISLIKIRPKNLINLFQFCNGISSNFLGVTNVRLAAVQTNLFIMNLL